MEGWKNMPGNVRNEKPPPHTEHGLVSSLVGYQGSLPCWILSAGQVEQLLTAPQWPLRPFLTPRSRCLHRPSCIRKLATTVRQRFVETRRILHVRTSRQQGQKFTQKNPTLVLESHYDCTCTVNLIILAWTREHGNGCLHMSSSLLLETSELIYINCVLSLMNCANMPCALVVLCRG